MTIVQTPSAEEGNGISKKALEKVAEVTFNYDLMPSFDMLFQTMCQERKKKERKKLSK